MYKCYANSLAFNLVEVSAFDLKPQKRTCNSSPTMELLQALFTSEASLTFVDFLPLAEEI